MISRDNVDEDLDKEADKFAFIDARNAYVLAHRKGSEYIYDIDDVDVHEEGLTLMNEFNAWILKFSAFGIAKEKKRAKEEGAQPPTPTSPQQE